MKPLASLIVASLLLAAAPLFGETVNVGPGQSLQEAANKLNPGDTLLLAEGTYYQSLTLTRSGTAGSPITIRAKAPGKVIVTGAMRTTPKFERVQGAIHKPVPASIKASREAPKLERIEGAVYKTKWIPARKWSGSGTGQAWVIADGRNLYNYTSMEEMRTCRRKGRDTAPLEGFFYKDKELYIRLLGGADANRAKIAISRPDTAILLEIKGQEHIVLEGLRFHVAPNNAVRLGVRRHPHTVSKHIVIRDCYFFGSHRAIVGQNVRVDRPGGAVEFGPSDITVEYCQFSNYPTYDWLHYSMHLEQPAWRAMYHSTLGGNAILPGGNVSAWKIRHCYIHDTYDGIGVASTGVKDPKLDHEYAYNLLHRCADDNIEFDSIRYAGVRVHHNVILEGQCLLGLSPVQRGGVTIDHNIVYASPGYGIPWSVIFKFSTPGGSAWWRGGFHPLSGMTIRNNTLINAKSGVSWGTSTRHGKYFKDDNVVAYNIIYARDWNFCSGLPWKEGLRIQKSNLCVGPRIEAGKDAPPGVLCSRMKEPFANKDTYFRDVMPPSVPGLVPKEEIGPEIEIARVGFAVRPEYVQAAVKECNLDAAEYKDVHKHLGAVPPGTRWEFPRPGPRWAVGGRALFRPPLPPSLDPWWVGFSDKPSDAKTVKIRPWRGKYYKKFEKSGDGSDPVR
ncbi:MAG: hypothetical protein AMK72_14000 [Planctomycetes bacterium SM23_25]|nr:MAG: hypothetical protein AMK72_14000 [Planctomycetes bacterium SM23_25]